jgi:hypothetical protein
LKRVLFVSVIMLVVMAVAATFHQQVRAANPWGLNETEDGVIWDNGGPLGPYNNTAAQQHAVVPDLLITCQGHTVPWCYGYLAGWTDALPSNQTHVR